MKKTVIICLAAIFACNMFAQQQTIDSLINLLSTEKLSGKEQINIYGTLCRELKNSNIPMLLTYSEEGLQLAKKEHDKRMMAEFYKHSGDGYYLTGKVDAALIYLDKALELAVEIKDREYEAVILGSIGNLHNTQRNYNAAIECYKKAGDIFENMGKKESYLLTLTNIAGIHVELGNYSQAKEYLEKAKQIAEETDNPQSKLHVYYNLGNIASRENRNEESIEYNLKCLEISRAIGHVQAEIMSLSALAYDYCKGTKEFDKAEKYALECLQKAETYGAPRVMTTAWGILSVVYLYQKRFKECETVSLKAWEADSTLSMDNINTLINLTSAYIYLNDENNAIHYFKKCVELLMKHSDQEFKTAIADMEIKYETAKKELTIDKLEKEHTLYTWIIAISVMGVLLVLCLLYVRQRLNRQKIKQLEQEKQLVASQAVIDGEAAERTRLARDLHDGLGGMLSVVKLNLKDMKGYSLIENTDVANFSKAVEMLDKSIAELRRVSHHIMPDLSSGLKIPLEDFCRSIPEANFRFFGDDEHLDNRIKITVYRCAHELINNAIKHAKATTINVQLTVDERLISLSVQDDGSGFDPDKTVKGLGLESVKARVAIYNGKVNIYSSPEKGGTEINMEIELS